MRRGGPTSCAASAIVALLAPAASAEPVLEASGFVGLGWFSSDTELGNSWAPEQVPGTAPVLGGRLSYLVAPRLVESEGVSRLAFAIEAEVAMAASYTGGSSFDGAGRMSYFAPVFGWRAHAALRAGGTNQVTPHILVGFGGETVASASPFMSKETDPIFYYGPGVTVPLAGRWQLRIDMRHGIMAGRVESTSSVFELQFGIGATLDGTPARLPRTRVDDTEDTEPIVRRKPRPIEAPPPEPPRAPPPDRDKDGLADAVDKCPAEAEDTDGFADDDGCPDLDDDNDLVDDARDKCPRQPETRNGIADDDGCPDEIPAYVAKAFAGAATVRFEAGRARVTPAAQTALQPLFALLDERRELRIVVVGHPDKAGGEDLAKRRAEAVKWYFVDAGMMEDRVEAKVGAADDKAAITIELAPAKSVGKP